MSTADLGRRWGVSLRAAYSWVRSWETDDHEFCPRVERKTGRLFVSRSDVEKWEALRRRLRLPLPGEKPRGPKSASQ